MVATGEGPMTSAEQAQASDHASPRRDGTARPLHSVVEDLAAATELRSLSRLLDELAALAQTDRDALALLLEVIVDRNLAEVSIRKVFFDEDRVDDAVQETVLSVVGGIAGFRGDAAFLTWLDRLALNAARQIRRRSQRLSEPVSNNVPEHGAWVRRVSSIVADEVVVNEAFARLSPDHAAVIRLREIEDLTYEDIATTLGVAIGTVRSRLSRARAELAQHLVTLQQGV